MWDNENGPRVILLGLMFLIAIVGILVFYLFAFIQYIINKRICKEFFNETILAVMRDEGINCQYHIKVCIKDERFRYYLYLNDKEIEINSSNASSEIKEAFVSQGFI
jgi:hypothetical protein